MKNRGWTVLLIVSLVIAICIVAEALFGLDPEQPNPSESRAFPCVKIASAYMALVEHPEAKRVLLLGDQAKEYGDIFIHAGLECATEAGGEFDIVFAAGLRPQKIDRAAHRVLKRNGLWVECVDARAQTLGDFKKTLASMPGKCVHVWMPGELDWLVTSRAEEVKPKLEDMIDLFTREGGFEDLVTAKCDTLPVIFASYAGTREDIMPAFERQDMTLGLRPEYFILRKVPSMDWMSAEGIDDDIREGLMHEIRSVQVVRRIILVGVMQAERGEEEKSVESWAKAALRSPGDTMLVERLDRLSVNAEAFLKLGKAAMAARCYDTMAQIMPNDPLPVYNYGICMRQLGEEEVANLAFKHADELARAIQPPEEPLEAPPEEQPAEERARRNSP